MTFCDIALHDFIDFSRMCDDFGLITERLHNRRATGLYDFDTVTKTIVGFKVIQC